MNPLLDITRPLYNGLPPWPGDTPFSYGLSWKMDDGATVNVGALAMSTHSGTHADAPRHFQPDGAGIDALDLGAYLGPALVVDVVDCAKINRKDLAPLESAIRGCRRVLFKTGAWKDPTVFPTSIPTMSAKLPAWLGELGVVLVGLDVPSVDELDSQELPIHHALAAARIAILESLDLSHVPPGRYELIALPLKIAGGDAAPVRAVLREAGA